MVPYLPATAPLGDQHQAFDAMSRFCGLASTTGRSLSGIPVPTLQPLATECGHKIFVPGRVVGINLWHLMKVDIFQLSATQSTFCVNYLIMAQAGNKAYVCAIESIAVIE